MLKKIILLIISAIMLSLPLGNRALYFLSWFGFLPALQVFCAESTFRNTGLLGWLWGWFLALGAGYWLYHPINDFSGLPYPLILVFVGLLLAVAGLFTAGWAVIFKLLSSGKKFSVFIFSFTWVGFEFIRNLIFPYYPFGFLGLTQTGFDSFLQLAELGGTFLISLITALIAGFIFKFYRRRRLRYALLVLVIIFASYQYSSGALEEAESIWQEEKRSLSAGVVMTEVPQVEKWKEENIEKNLQIMAEDSSKLFEENAEIVFTPETGLTFDYLYNEYYRNMFLVHLEESGYLMIGSQARGDTPQDSLNSYFLLDDQGEVLERYNKNDLIPGEVIPFAGVVELFTGREWHSLTAGEERKPIDFETAGGEDAVFRVLTCSEILYASPDYSELDDIDFVLNPSNEAWFGDTNLQNQMWESARMRAVELRAPVIKSGNKAKGGYIAPTGGEELTEQSRRIEADIGRASQGLTPYQRYGDYAGYLSLVMMIIIFPGLKILRIS